MLSFSYPTLLFSEQQHQTIHSNLSTIMQRRCEASSSDIYFEIMITQETLDRVAMWCEYDVAGYPIEFLQTVVTLKGSAVGQIFSVLVVGESGYFFTLCRSSEQGVGEKSGIVVYMMVMIWSSQVLILACFVLGIPKIYFN